MSTVDVDHLFDDPALLEAKAAADLRAARDRDAWQWMMGSTHGRRIARALVATSGLMVGGCSADAAAAGYREGRRSIGLEVLAAVKAHAPEHFTTLFEEEADE